MKRTTRVAPHLGFVIAALDIAKNLDPSTAAKKMVLHFHGAFADPPKKPVCITFCVSIYQPIFNLFCIFFRQLNWTDH